MGHSKCRSLWRSPALDPRRRSGIVRYAASRDVVHSERLTKTTWSKGVYYLGAPGTEIAGSELDWERKDEFWASCIRRTERMLDGTVTHIIGEDADAGEEMTPFRPPIELDCILDQTWYASLDIRNAYLSTFDREPVGEVLLNKAKESNAEILVVIKHHKSWVQKIFSGSVSEYVIDKSEIIYYTVVETNVRSRQIRVHRASLRVPSPLRRTLVRPHLSHPSSPVPL
jgi:hypothetical protein